MVGRARRPGVARGRRRGRPTARLESPRLRTPRLCPGLGRPRGGAAAVGHPRGTREPHRRPLGAAPSAGAVPAVGPRPAVLRSPLAVASLERAAAGRLRPAGLRPVPAAEGRRRLFARPALNPTSRQVRPVGPNRVNWCRPQVADYQNMTCEPVRCRRRRTRIPRRGPDGRPLSRARRHPALAHRPAQSLASYPSSPAGSSLTSGSPAAASPSWTPTPTCPRRWPAGSSRRG